MRLYVANATKQNVDFLYRVPERQSWLQQRIPIGGQVQVTGELSRDVIDYIIQQHVKYGIVSADEVDRTREFTGLCYSVDKPVQMAKIEKLIRHNTDELVKLGKQIRQESAVASSVSLEGEIDQSGRNEVLRNFEASIVEENHDDRDEGPAIAEGIRVNRSGEAAPKTARRRR
jgi:hypothetical protein